MTAACHSMIADILHRYGIMDGEGFSLAAARQLEQLPRWSKAEIVRELNRIQTSIFQRSPDPPKKVVLEIIGAELLERWPSYPFNPPEMASKVKILFLGANPIEVVAAHPTTNQPLSVVPLGLDEEVREIQKLIRGSNHRDSLELFVRLAVRPDDLIQALNEVKPEIVHISGHGSDSDELFLLDDSGRPHPVKKSAIAALFKTMKGNIRVVVLNACYSRSHATTVTKNVDCAIGMSREVGDRAAVVFAAAFYRAIGFGHSVKQAFDQGIVALRLAGIDEHSTPKLMVRKGVNPDQLRLL